MCDDSCLFHYIKKKCLYLENEGQKELEECRYWGNEFDGLCSCEACELVNIHRMYECLNTSLGFTDPESYIVNEKIYND